MGWLAGQESIDGVRGFATDGSQSASCVFRQRLAWQRVAQNSILPSLLPPSSLSPSLPPPSSTHISVFLYFSFVIKSNFLD